MRNSISLKMQVGRSLKDIGPILKNSLIYQRGYSYNYIPRRRVQYGRGFGSVFAGLARFFKPLLVKGLKAVGREVLDAGSDILTNIDKEPVNNLIKTRSETAYNNLKRKAIAKLDPLMKGEGKRRKRRKVKKIVHKGRGFRTAPSKRQKRCINTNRSCKKKQSSLGRRPKDIFS